MENKKLMIEKATFPVTGMMCAVCAGTVQKTVGETDWREGGGSEFRHLIRDRGMGFRRDVASNDCGGGAQGRL